MREIKKFTVFACFLEDTKALDTNSLDGDTGSFKSFRFSWVAAFSRLLSADCCQSLTSMAITDIFTCLRVVLKRLCVAFMSSIVQQYNKNSPATTTAKGKERRNEREREKINPMGFNHPLHLSIQFPKSRPQICNIAKYVIYR